MDKLRKIIYLILSILGVIVTLGSLLSTPINTEIRYLKMLDFPRIQFFIVALIILIFIIPLTKKWRWYNYLLVMSIATAIVIQSNYLINYTSFVPESVLTVTDQDNPAYDQISIVIANVKMSNRTTKPLFDLIETKNPDLIITLEIDEWWDKQLISIEKDYTYTQKKINEVAYGMTLYSKFPLEDVKVNYLQNDNVPSFETVIQLNSGRRIMLYSVHPVPPTMFEKYPDNAGEQEVTLIKVGKKVKENRLPSIVAGDFNDVSWGDTDQLTKTNNILHDIRVGRGFYNSYDANNILMRWPLDHILVTKQFRVISIERMPNIGSDHFPIYCKLVL